jgi:hypothetical protein
MPEEVFCEGINTQAPLIILLGVSTLTTVCLCRQREGQKGPEATRDCHIIPTNPTYLLSRLQHLILTQTQRLIEECRYNLAEKWFQSLLEANGWDVPEAVELTKW